MNSQKQSHMNPIFSGYSSFDSSLVIVAAVVVVLVVLVVAYGGCILYYLHHSEHKKGNLCNSSRSRTLGIGALIVLVEIQNSS
jgi:predicted Na+-dependent transporter